MRTDSLEVKLFKRAIKAFEAHEKSVFVKNGDLALQHAWSEEMRRTEYEVMVNLLKRYFQRATNHPPLTALGNLLIVIGAFKD